MSSIGLSLVRKAQYGSMNCVKIWNIPCLVCVCYKVYYSAVQNIYNMFSLTLNLNLTASNLQWYYAPLVYYLLLSYKMYICQHLTWQLVILQYWLTFKQRHYNFYNQFACLICYDLNYNRLKMSKVSCRRHNYSIHNYSIYQIIEIYIMKEYW